MIALSYFQRLLTTVTRCIVSTSQDERHGIWRTSTPFQTLRWCMRGVQKIMQIFQSFFYSKPEQTDHIRSPSTNPPCSSTLLESFTPLLKACFIPLFTKAFQCLVYGSPKVLRALKSRFSEFLLQTWKIQKSNDEYGGWRAILMLLVSKKSPTTASAQPAVASLDFSRCEAPIWHTISSCSSLDSELEWTEDLTSPEILRPLLLSYLVSF